MTYHHLVSSSGVSALRLPSDTIKVCCLCKVAFDHAYHECDLFDHTQLAVYAELRTHADPAKGNGSRHGAFFVANLASPGSQHDATGAASRGGGIVATVFQLRCFVQVATGYPQDAYDLFSDANGFSPLPVDESGRATSLTDCGVVPGAMVFAVLKSDGGTSSAIGGAEGRLTARVPPPGASAEEVFAVFADNAVRHCLRAIEALRKLPIRRASPRRRQTDDESETATAFNVPLPPPNIGIHQRQTMARSPDADVVDGSGVIPPSGAAFDMVRAQLERRWADSGGSSHMAATLDAVPPRAAREPINVSPEELAAMSQHTTPTLVTPSATNAAAMNTTAATGQVSHTTKTDVTKEDDSTRNSDDDGAAQKPSSSSRAKKKKKKAAAALEKKKETAPEVTSLEKKKKKTAHEKNALEVTAVDKKAPTTAVGVQAQAGPGGRGRGAAAAGRTAIADDGEDREGDPPLRWFQRRAQPQVPTAAAPPQQQERAAVTTGVPRRQLHETPLGRRDEVVGSDEEYHDALEQGQMRGADGSAEPLAPFQRFKSHLTPIAAVRAALLESEAQAAARTAHIKFIPDTTTDKEFAEFLLEHYGEFVRVRMRRKSPHELLSPPRGVNPQSHGFTYAFVEFASTAVFNRCLDDTGRRWGRYKLLNLVALSGIVKYDDNDAYLCNEQGERLLGEQQQGDSITRYAADVHPPFFRLRARRCRFGSVPTSDPRTRFAGGMISWSHVATRDDDLMTATAMTTTTSAGPVPPTAAAANDPVVIVRHPRNVRNDDGPVDPILVAPPPMAQQPLAELPRRASTAAAWREPVNPILVMARGRSQRTVAANQSAIRSPPESVMPTQQKAEQVTPAAVAAVMPSSAVPAPATPPPPPSNTTATATPSTATTARERREPPLPVVVGHEDDTAAQATRGGGGGAAGGGGTYYPLLLSPPYTQRHDDPAATPQPPQVPRRYGGVTASPEGVGSSTAGGGGSGRFSDSMTLPGAPPCSPASPFGGGTTTTAYPLRHFGSPATTAVRVGPSVRFGFPVVASTSSSGAPPTTAASAGVAATLGEQQGGSTKPSAPPPRTISRTSTMHGTEALQALLDSALNRRRHLVDALSATGHPPGATGGGGGAEWLWKHISVQVIPYDKRILDLCAQRYLSNPSGAFYTAAVVAANHHLENPELTYTDQLRARLLLVAVHVRHRCHSDAIKVAFDTFATSNAPSVAVTSGTAAPSLSSQQGGPPSSSPNNPTAAAAAAAVAMTVDDLNLLAAVAVTLEEAEPFLAMELFRRMSHKAAAMIARAPRRSGGGGGGGGWHRSVVGPPSDDPTASGAANGGTGGGGGGGGDHSKESESAADASAAAPPAVVVIALLDVRGITHRSTAFPIGGGSSSETFSPTSTSSSSDHHGGQRPTSVLRYLCAPGVSDVPSAILAGTLSIRVYCEA